MAVNVYVTRYKTALTPQMDGPHLSQRSALQGISPYLGRLESSRARELILALTESGQIVHDPFCGSGTIPLEAWATGRQATGGDRNPYAIAISKAKLNPIPNVEDALQRIDRIQKHVDNTMVKVDLRGVPLWVRKFYHRETLREAIAWAEVLRSRREHFLFGCLLNILHHQRPGFLSYPSSHVTPYLRAANFPAAEFPELYEKRDVRSRLEKKVCRTLKTPIQFDFNLRREITFRSAERAPPSWGNIDCIVTSPPYMSELDYGRDNRLRLWFCGSGNWKALDATISPKRHRFLELMSRCATRWETLIKPGGHIALVLGDSRRSGQARVDVPKLVLETIQKTTSKLKLLDIRVNEMPPMSRVIKGRTGTLFESTLIFQKR